MGTSVMAAPPSDFELHSLERAYFQSPGKRFSTTQRLFFETLLASHDMDVSKAAKKVGVQPTTAKKWMAKPYVQRAVDHLIAKRFTRLGIDPDQTLIRVAEFLEMAAGDRPIKKAVYDKATGQYETQEVYETDLSAAARFSEQLSKHLGLYKDDEHNGLQVQIALNLGGEAIDTSYPLGLQQGLTIEGEASPADSTAMPHDATFTDAEETAAAQAGRQDEPAPSPTSIDDLLS